MDSATQITIYEPNQRLKQGWIATWLQMFKNIRDSRELIYVLFKRDLVASYKKSFIGWIWIFISPIVGIISWVLMNSTGILNPGDVGVPYPVYVLLGSSIWGLFMSFYGASSSTLGSGSEFIMQVKYPHEALLVKQVMLSSVNFLISFTLNIVVLLLFGVIPSIAILAFPLLVIPLLLLGSAIGLMLSLISVVATDISSAFNMLFGFVFYITPIVYSVNTDNQFLNTVVQYNPMTYLVGGARDMILYGSMDNFLAYGLFTILSLVLFLVSLRLFYVSEGKVVEKMI